MANLTIALDTCFECGSNGPLHQHHVVPKARGGTKTIPLCEDCHSKVHGKCMKISNLTKAALAAKKAQGVKLGGPVPISEENRLKGVAAIKEKARSNEHNQRAAAMARQLRENGWTYDRIAEHLNEAKFKTPRGATWQRGSVYQLLKKADQYLGSQAS